MDRTHHNVASKVLLKSTDDLKPSHISSSYLYPLND